MGGKLFVSDFLLDLIGLIVGIPFCGSICFFVFWLITLCIPFLKKRFHWEATDGTVDMEKIEIGIGACCVTLLMVVIVDFIARY
jgi:hypothetical protein